MSEADAFEAALRDNPDDLAGWCAYADYLVERGDPRGEFMQVQIALEDESRAKAERDALKKRETRLIAANEGDWIGKLVRYLDAADREDDPRPNAEYRWRRGFLSELKVDCITVALGQVMADSPQLRLLQKLHVVSTAYYLSMRANQPPRRRPSEYREYDEWLEVLGAPLLQSLRVFQMGDIDGEPPEDGWSDCHTYAPGIHRLIAEMPRLEELHLLCKRYESADLFSLPNLTNLRVLRMYHLGGFEHERRYEYALDVLAANPALGNLTHLLFHPHFAEEGGYDDVGARSYLPLAQVRELLRSPHLKKLTHLQLRLSDMGDEGVRAFVDSGILKRLKWLDLRHGCITDEGAAAFAACPDAKNLERLDLARNAVTSEGLRALRAAGVNAVANQPLTQDELDSREYLREGDSE